MRRRRDDSPRGLTAIRDARRILEPRRRRRFWPDSHAKASCRERRRGVNDVELIERHSVGVGVVECERPPGVAVGNFEFPTLGDLHAAVVVVPVEHVDAADGGGGGEFEFDRLGLAALGQLVQRGIERSNEFFGSRPSIIAAVLS